MDSLIKYSRLINKSINPSFISKYNLIHNKNFTSAQIWQAQEQSFFNDLKNHGIVKIFDGETFQKVFAYGINCSLFYRIFEKPQNTQQQFDQIGGEN